MTSTGGPAIVFILTTLGEDADAAAFARTLVEEKLAACVSVLPPMTSIYRWKGTIEQAREQQLLIKTTPGHVSAVQQRFQTLHPYELAEFVVIRPEDVGRIYGDWVIDSVQ